jgi:hypothetical protein
MDPRNNSAWNERWFVCHRGGSVKSLPLEDAKKEADYAIQGARLDPYNESPWRYLIGILKEQIKVTEDKMALLNEYERKAYGLREELEQAGTESDSCTNLTSAWIDILEFKGDPSSLEKVSKYLMTDYGKGQVLSHKVESNVVSSTKALNLASALASEHDPIRKKYWLLRVDEMNQALK